MKKKIRIVGPTFDLRTAIHLSEGSLADVINIQVLKTGTFYDPRYGKFSITKKMLSEMIDNFNKGTIKKDISLDYIHNADDKAAAWFQSLQLKEMGDGVTGLFADVELTGSGKRSLSEKEFRYISADFDPNWKDNEKQENHGCVLEGAALTNRPVIKGMKAIRLSESSEGGLEEEIDLDKIDLDNSGDSAENLKKRLTELEAQYAPIAKLMEEKKLSVSDIEKLIKPSEEKTPMTPEEQKQLDEAKAEAARLKAENEEANKKLQLSEKNSKFDKMMVKGEVVEAQRQPFLDGDMEKFVSLQVKVKLSETGSGNGNGGDGDEDIEDKMAVEINELMKSGNMTFSEATKRVAAKADNKKGMNKKFYKVEVSKSEDEE